MSTNTTSNNIYERSFQIKGCAYNVIIIKELNPITCKPTGNYIGTFISSIRGTGNFKLNKNQQPGNSNLDLLNPGLTPELLWIINEIEEDETAAYNKQSLVKSTNDFPYHFTIKDIAYRDTDFKMALTPELCADDEGIDFTGNYIVTLISTSEGTKQFELLRDEHLRWIGGENARGMDPGMIDVIAGIIGEIRK